MTLELLKSNNIKSQSKAVQINLRLKHSYYPIFLKHFSKKAKIKSVFDKLAALLGIIILLPFFIFIAILIMAETGAFPFFRQYRTGYMGQPFKIWKFRTMYVSDNGSNIPQASKNDVRITKLGRFLRRSSIDELPQLFNVLMGEMSLIGPRPHAIAHDIYYSNHIKDYELRYLVKPGMSGLAQICGYRGPTDKIFKMENRIKKDHEYIQNWSLKLDFKILCQTFFCLNSQNAI